MGAVYFIKLYFVGLGTILFFDFLWLGIGANKFYKKELGDLVRTKDGKFDVVWPAATLVYLLAVLGLVVFVLPQTQGSLLRALLFGGLFGLVGFSIYDFTNLSTIKNWPLKLTYIDLAWGTFNCALASAVMTLVAHLI